MDKKQKKKWIPAICFVVVCGVVCLGIRYGDRKEEQIVMEKHEDAEKFRETVDMPEVTEAPERDGDAKEEQPEEIYVHMCGAVVSEGVYVLPKGSRVADGIEAAGGFGENADTTYHNLASVLFDGQKVYVPTPEETKELPAEHRLMQTGAETSGGNVSGTGKRPGKVNLNTAVAEELMTLDGIGEAKAMRILQYREKVGAFQSIEEIKNVSGIGEAMFERIKEDIVTK